MTINWDNFNPPGFNVSPYERARVTDAKGAFFVEFQFITDPFDPAQNNGADWLFAQEGLAAATELRNYAGNLVETELGARRRFYSRVLVLANQAVERFQIAFNNVEGQTVKIGPGRPAAVAGAKHLWNAYVLLAAWHAANAADVPPFPVERVRYPSRARGTKVVTRLVRGRPPVSNTPAYVPAQIPYTVIGGTGGFTIPGNPPPGLGEQTESPPRLPPGLGEEGSGEGKPAFTQSSAVPLIIGGVVAVGLLLAATRR
jgi:hypothetical protein